MLMRMEHGMILSASGWRKIFAESGESESRSAAIGEANSFLSILIAETFAEYMISRTGKKHPAVVVAADTRPTGAEIARNVIMCFSVCGIKTVYLGISAAPEIMAYAKKHDGFLYISASHNPIGYNGIKFGLNDGGVLPGSESKKLAARLEEKCAGAGAEEHALSIAVRADKNQTEKIYARSGKYKKAALKEYERFIRTVISGSAHLGGQNRFFGAVRASAKKNPLRIVCDMNGSARAASIDRKLIASCGMHFSSFNDAPGQIVHEIIPEPENLVYCARYIDSLQSEGKTDALLGYMPDCDGDRGNSVYWDEAERTARTVPAQEVFALCVLSELAFEYWKNSGAKKLAVAVNCPTSMRIDEICRCMNAQVFRAEVGEANVVNLAREKRSEGFSVRIFGEGSNGGNITYPSAVRDPVATLFALVKLLSIRDGKKGGCPGLFHIWCTMSHQEEKYRDGFTLRDVIATLPQYTTTGVSEPRAVLRVKTADKGMLKQRFKKEFEADWELKKNMLLEELGIASYECFVTNGTAEVKNPAEWNNGTGGLKVMFLSARKEPKAFFWMRPSGTEPVFRVLCDVKGNRPETEKRLLAWETELINRADGCLS